MTRMAVGDLVLVMDAAGEKRRKRVLIPRGPGTYFEVVWACSEEEWDAALAEGRKPQGMAWPASDVEPLPDPALPGERAGGEEPP